MVGLQDAGRGRLPNWKFNGKMLSDDPLVGQSVGLSNQVLGFIEHKLSFQISFCSEEVAADGTAAGGAQSAGAERHHDRNPNGLREN